MKLDDAREVIKYRCADTDCDSCYISRLREKDSVISCMDVMREAAVVFRDALDGTEIDMPEVLTKKADDVINPNHYIGGRKYEPRRVIRDWSLNFNLGNAVKYIARAGRKDDVIQDLEKAKRYIEFEIEALKEERVQG